MHHDSDELPVTFLDYTFTLGKDGSIVFDSELRPDQLRVQQGDKFEVVFVPGNVVFKKIEGPAS